MFFLDRYQRIFSSLPSFGLDLSDKSVKFAYLEGSHPYEVADFGEVAIPDGLVESSEVTSKEKLSSFLKDVFSKRRMPKYVVASLPEERGFVRTIQLPVMPEEEIRSAVQWEIEANIPIPLNESLFDIEVLPRSDKIDHLDINVAAVPKSLAESYAEVFSQVGFVPIAFELESQAVARSVVPSYLSSKGAYVLCDLGATRTSITIFASGAIRFTASRAISSDGLTEELSKAFRIDFKLAEQKKREVGLGGQGEGRSIFEILLPTLKILAKEIGDAVEFYHSHASHVHAESKITQVYLCGGGANLTGLPHFLSRELGVQVERANPWVNILAWPPREVPPLEYHASLGYVTALGLALRGASFSIA